MTPAIFMFVLFSLLASNREICDLSITIPNINEKKGEIIVGVYNQSGKFPKVGGEYRLVHFPAKTPGSVFRVDDLQPGVYALAIFHDSNADGVCNTNMVGIPREGYGFSNNIKPVLSPPDFEDCQIQLTRDATVTVNLIY